MKKNEKVCGADFSSTMTVFWLSGAKCGSSMLQNLCVCGADFGATVSIGYIYVGSYKNHACVSVYGAEFGSTASFWCVDVAC